MYEIPNTDLIAMDESEYLEHFGIKGMRWGHRKASGSKAQKSATKNQVRSAKYKMLTARRRYHNVSRNNRSSTRSQKALSNYKETSGNYYNTKRQFKGKSTRSNVSASKIQMYKNSGASFLKKSAFTTLAATALFAEYSSPKQRQILKNTAQFVAAKGVAHLGSTAGKIYRSDAARSATSAIKSGAINKVVKAVKRRKKYGKYINTTGFSIPSATRLIGN